MNHLWKKILTRLHTPPRLGRWCHPSSEHYRTTCDAELKTLWNLYDHGFHTIPVEKPKAPKIERDCITCFLCD